MDMKKAGEDNDLVAKLFQQITYWPTYLILKIIFRYRVEGQENLKGLENRPVIFASNHAHNFDGPICAAAMPREGLVPKRFMPIRFLAATEYCHWQTVPLPAPLAMFTAFYVNINQSVPVVRGTGNVEESLAAAIKVINQGAKFWIYLEGKMTKDGNIQKGKRGVVYLHQKTGAVIVPVGLSGTYKMLSFKNLLKFLFGLKKMTVRIGRPIYSLNNVSQEEGVERVMEEIRTLVL
jgi:1-acyl-sn-glycerol-3-phosphate acyltransferase